MQDTPTCASAQGSSLSSPGSRPRKQKAVGQGYNFEILLAEDAGYFKRKLERSKDTERPGDALSEGLAHLAPKSRKLAQSSVKDFVGILARLVLGSCLL